MNDIITLKEYYYDVGLRVKKARLHSRTEIDILAILVGVKPQIIEDIENGTGIYNFDVMSRIARVLEISLEQIYPTL